MKYLILFLPLLVLFAGCGDESQLRPDDDGVSLGISSVSTNADKNVSALSARSATILAGGRIGVYRLSSSDYTAQNNVEYTYGSPWTTSTQIFISSKSASVCAYYPYSTTIGDDPATTGTVEGNDNPKAIPLTSQIYSSAADLCYASATSVSSSNPYANFTMDRAYAKMTFTITHDASYSGTCAISSIKISNAGIRSSNTLDITSGSYGTTTATGSTIFNPAIASITSGSSATATALIVPTISDTTSETLTGNITFLLTVDGKTRVASLPVSTNNLTTLAPGSNYQINVKISGSGMTLALAATAGNGGFDFNAVPPTANSYIVSPGNTITFPVNICGNGTLVPSTGITSSSINPESVVILWQTSVGLISSTFNATAKTVTITASGTPADGGNAVIAAYSEAGGTGIILWSWHIWVTTYDPNIPSNGAVYTYSLNTNNPLTFMDRNLGATSTTAVKVATLGLLYQWGRKDPFPGSASVTTNTEDTLYNAAGTGSNAMITKIAVSAESNLPNSIINPLTFYYSSSGNYDWYSTTTQNHALWGGASTVTPSAKTMFDPCPIGWRVPAWRNGSSPWGRFTALTFTNPEIWTINRGRVYTEASSTYYPAAGYRYFSSGLLSNVGNTGAYWSASPYNTKGYHLDFNSSSVHPTYYDLRTTGYSVRCVQE